jgi:radical SAM protein with 4Fe4S-binding SPASM domain
MTGIRLLKEYQINTQLQTVLMTINQDDIDDIQRFSQTNGFGYCKFDPFLFNDVYDQKKSYDYRVDPHEIALCEKKDKTRHETWMNFSCNVLSKGLSAVVNPLDCCSTCGISKLHIDPYGNMMGCNMMRKPSFNLREMSVSVARSMLIDKIIEIFEQPYPEELECKDCKIRHLCNCCPGVFYMENRDVNQKSKFACEIAHARHEVLDL